LYVLTEFTEIGAIIALLFFGVGTGIGFPALLNVTLKLAPENRRGMASGILYAMLFSGGSIGAVFAGSLINVVSPYYMAAKLQSLNVNFNSMLEKKLLLASTGVDKIVTMKQFLQPQIAKSVIQMLQQSFSYAAAIIIGSFIIISLISIMFTYFIKETNHS
ncbi:MAG: PucC family protein, partial [Pseudomonadota bacterium]